MVEVMLLSHFLKKKKDFNLTSLLSNSINLYLFEMIRPAQLRNILPLLQFSAISAKQCERAAPQKISFHSCHLFCLVLQLEINVINISPLLKQRPHCT